MVFLSFGPCKLQYQVARQGMLTEIRVAQLLGGNQFVSDGLWGLCHRRDSMPSTADVVKDPELMSTFILLNGYVVKPSDWYSPQFWPKKFLQRIAVNVESWLVKILRTSDCCVLDLKWDIRLTPSVFREHWRSKMRRGVRARWWGSEPWKDVLSNGNHRLLGERNSLSRDVALVSYPCSSG